MDVKASMDVGASDFAAAQRPQIPVAQASTATNLENKEMQAETRSRVGASMAAAANAAAVAATPIRLAGAVPAAFSSEDHVGINAFEDRTVGTISRRTPGQVPAHPSIATVEPSPGEHVLVFRLDEEGGPYICVRSILYIFKKDPILRLMDQKQMLSTIRQTSMNLAFEPVKARPKELRALKTNGELGRRAPSCLLLDISDIITLLSHFDRPVEAEFFRRCAAHHGKKLVHRDPSSRPRIKRRKGSRKTSTATAATADGASQV